MAIIKKATHQSLQDLAGKTEKERDIINHWPASVTPGNALLRGSEPIHFCFVPVIENVEDQQ